MPWTAKQQRVAQAVEHGWKPKGSAKGFTRDFAEQVISESKISAKDMGNFAKKHKGR